MQNIFVFLFQQVTKTITGKLFYILFLCNKASKSNVYFVLTAQVRSH